MDRVNRYLFRSFISLFSSMFFILFSITSVIFFIKIASITAVLQINFIELITMFIYLIPKLLIYTMPVTFFISLCITLFNLSKENELIVLFTLGRSPKQISRFFTIIAALFSILMIVNVAILIPLSKQLNKNFLEYKKVEAKFNIQDSKFGQKFSNWLVYIDKAEKNQIYKNVTLYKKGKDHENSKLILSKRALIQNADGVLRLVLENGKAFEFKKDKIEQINFEKMYINSKHNENIGYIQTIHDYWELAFKDKSRAYDFAFFILISLFPLTSVFLAIGLSTVTSRYSSNGIYFYIFASVALYFALVFLLARIEPFSSILFVSAITTSVSYLIYKKQVALRY